MEDKSIKDFDRAIEQMMNEHAVTPPFGAWNRIAAELDAPVAAPVAPGRTVPVAAIGGFVAGALLIGGIVAGVLVYNGNSLNNITYPIASNTQPQVATETTLVAPVVEQEDNIATESNEGELKTIAALSANTQATKANTAPKVVEHTKTLTNNNDVAVPEVAVGNNANMVSMPYYFPPIDISVDSQAEQQNAAPAAKPKETIAKSSTSTSEVKKRNSSPSVEFRGVKFKKKKKSKFTYGSIIRAKKH